MSRSKEAWERLAALAANQFGTFTIAQAESAGVTREMRRTLLRRGVVRKVGLHCLRINGFPHTFSQACAAAVLDTGGKTIVAGDGGLALWKVPGVEAPVGRIPLLAPRPAWERNSPLARLHECDVFEERHAVTVNGIRVLAPTRLIFDAAYELGEHRLPKAINYFGRRRFTSGPLLHRMADELFARGRAGTSLLRDLLETKFPIDWVPPGSNLEVRFEEIVVAAGMPRPVRQVDVGDEGRWLGRVDFKDPVLPALAEIQSDEWHVAPLDAEDDAVRIARLRAAGFYVAEFSDFEVWHRPAIVTSRWAETRRLAGAAA